MEGVQGGAAPAALAVAVKQMKVAVAVAGIAVAVAASMRRWPHPPAAGWMKSIVRAAAAVRSLPSRRRMSR